VIGLIIAAAVMLGWFGDGPGAGPILAGLVAIGLLFLLHRSRSGQGVDGGSSTATLGVPAGAAAEDTTTATATGAPAAPTGTGPSLVKDVPAGAGPVWPEPAATPPSWDPLGAAPFAWDLPEPGPVTPPAPQAKRPPVTPVTMGVALLAAGVTAFVLLLAGALTLANVPILLGVLLAVVGLGLVVGSFTRAGRGLIPIALLLCALTWGTLTAPLDRWNGGGVGDVEYTPRTAADVLPLYERTAGNINLDLSRLNLAVPPGGDSSPIRTRIELGAGDVEITVPRNADVTLTGSAGVGEMSFGDYDQSGFDLSLDETDLGADGVASGRRIVLDVEQGAGNLEVLRG
jgi:hypothetical protein